MNSKHSIDGLIDYCKALRNHGPPVDEQLIVETHFTLDSAYRAMKDLLLMAPPPTAALMINDYSAFGSFRAARDMRKKIAEDISIVGFGDVPLVSMVNPPLTTFHAPPEEMGQWAADMLLKLIRKKKLTQKHLIFPWK